MKASVNAALAGWATAYLGLEGKERWAHSEERRAWSHPRMASGFWEKPWSFFAMSGLPWEEEEGEGGGGQVTLRRRRV